MMKQPSGPLRVLMLLNDASGGASLSALQLLHAFPREEVIPYAVTALKYNEDDWQRFAEVCEDTRYVRAQWWNLDESKPMPMQWMLFANALRHNRFFSRPVLQLLRLIREWRIDIVHTNTLLNLDGAIAARIANIPHVWHIREFTGSSSHFHFPVNKNWIERIVYGLSDRVIFNSSMTMLPLHGDWVPQKARLIFNAIDPSAFEDPAAAVRGRELRKELGIADNELLVGMAAGFRSRWKRHVEFIHMANSVARKNPNARFVIFGEHLVEGERGHDAMLELYQLVNRCGLKDRLLLPGYRRDVPALMHAMDLMAHPALNESFGRVLIEAMAAGKPVVASANGGPIDIVQDGVTGALVDPADFALFTRRVSELVRDADLREAYGKAGRKRVREKFSLDVLAASMLREYREVSAQRPAQ